MADQVWLPPNLKLSDSQFPPSNGPLRGRRFGERKHRHGRGGRGRRLVALTPLVPVVSTASTVEGEPIRIPLFDLLDIGRASQTGAAAASSSSSVASVALPPPGFGAEPQYIHFEDSSHGLDAKIAVVLNQHGVYCKALMEDLVKTVS